MSMIKGWSDQIEQIYRRVEQGSTGKETAADELFRDTEHLPKMLIMDPAFHAVFSGLQLHFLCNSTSHPFLSSDSPVCLTHRHADEVTSLMPAAYTRAQAPTNERRPLVLCPLTPALMLLACEFVSDQYAGLPFITIIDSTQSKLLNVSSIENAQGLLLSSTCEPFGQDQPAIAAVLRGGSCGARQHGVWMLLYTSEHRYWLPLESYQHTLQSIDFTTPSLDLLQQASDDGSLVSAEIFVNGHSRGGMREIRFEHVDVTGKLRTRIASRIKLPPHMKR
jgi:hypothetical protein